MTRIVGLSIFDKHAPLKYKYIRADQAPFMNKTLLKAVMKRSKHRNKSLKTKTSLNTRKVYLESTFSLF